MPVTIDGKTFTSSRDYWTWKIETAKEKEQEALALHIFLSNWQPVLLDRTKH